MTPRLQILAATYRTLDITEVIRNEVRGRKPLVNGSISIDLWNIIPWHHHGLINAPAPETLVVVWRILLKAGSYAAVRVATAGPTETLVIKFEKDVFKPVDRREEKVKNMELVNATYFDHKLGFKDITTTVQPMFTATTTPPDTPISLPISQHIFGGSPSSASRGCKNQLTVSYWRRTSNGTVMLKCVAGSTGDTLSIPYDEEDGNGTSITKSLHSGLPTRTPTKSLLDLKTVLSNVIEIPHDAPSPSPLTKQTTEKPFKRYASLLNAPIFRGRRAGPIAAG